MHKQHVMIFTFEVVLVVVVVVVAVTAAEVVLVEVVVVLDDVGLLVPFTFSPDPPPVSLVVVSVVVEVVLEVVLVVVLDEVLVLADIKLFIGLALEILNNK